MAVAYASGKIILFGEHSVVYGRPAIAVPVTQVKAQATVEGVEEGRGITVVARDLGRTYRLDQAPPDDPLRQIIVLTLERLGHGPRGLAPWGVGLDHDLTITISSTIPIARGLGSGAAVSTAIVRALIEHFSDQGCQPQLGPQDISDLVFETERIHHGTPSGIDNTVIAFEKPVYFVKDKTCEVFQVKRPLLIAIGDTGVPSPTKLAVSDVRRAWEREPSRYNRLFDRMGEIAVRARQAIERGGIGEIGHLMDENQRLLQEIGVSSPELERLIEAARKAGALGAKLSGAGRGGNMIALVTKKTKVPVVEALRQAGATAVILTEVR